MNVFVLCTGRCGSTTFIEACKHITNYTAAHESRSNLLGDTHFDYPPNHIEADNRLSWFLGRLDRKYGDEACYVHLKRDRLETARSFVNRYTTGIINVYRSGILMGRIPNPVPLDICLDYWATVNANIEAFLKDKTRKTTVFLQKAQEDFPVFWNLIGATGDLEAALLEWNTVYNASGPSGDRPPANDQKQSIVSRALRKVNRTIRQFRGSRPTA